MVQPLFNWLDKRSAGVLLHPTSLPNQYLIGNFGSSAKSFVDFLVSGNLTYWQVLPLGPTGFGDSPYQSYSSHAINSYLIDWDALIELDWIDQADMAPLYNERNACTDCVDFDRLRALHNPLCKKAMHKGLKDLQFADAFALFKKNHAHWVNDFALFMVLKDLNNGEPWNKWVKEHREYSSAKTIAKTSESISSAIEVIVFEQFVLHLQWSDLKIYANAQGVQIIGDIPIYVSPDSVDVWANRAVFQLTKAGVATKLAGVPPDYFNEDGQFWGNPLYNWAYLKETAYRWWIDRLKHTLFLFDVVRFDHFRALASYWSIPGKASTAKAGKWVKGPGIDFFNEIKKKLPESKLILEDLGEITPDVIELKEKTGCPGLAVLQFAFGGGSDNYYLPHNVSQNTVIYTGTHDNDTTLGWYHSAGETIQDHFRRYLQVSGVDAPWDMIRAAYRSNAYVCIVPIQDVLALDTSARMNVPGIATGNWSWRMNHDQMFHFGKTSTEYLKSLASLYGRI
jgi:4-alpha-glucanotransferase